MRNVPLVEMMACRRRPAERLAENLFREPVRVDVGRVEHRHARVEAHVHESRRMRDVACTPALEELVAAAERHRAHAQHGHLESRSAQPPEFHPPIISQPAAGLGGDRSRGHVIEVRHVGPEPSGRRVLRVPRNQLGLVLRREEVEWISLVGVDELQVGVCHE